MLLAGDLIKNGNNIRRITEVRETGYTWEFIDVPNKDFLSEDSSDPYFEIGWERIDTIYLVLEHASYFEYDVTFTTFDKKKAIDFIKSREGDGNKFYLKERVLDKPYQRVEE